MKIKVEDWWWWIVIIIFLHHHYHHYFLSLLSLSLSPLIIIIIIISVDSKCPIDFGVYDEVVDKCVLALKAVMDYILQILQYEINSRCFYYFQKYAVMRMTMTMTTMMERDGFINRLNESFTSNSYNNVPPVIMELMKDMKGFSDIVIRLVWTIIIIIFMSFS